MFNPHRSLSVALLMILAAASGCQTDHRPVYVAPALAADQMVTINTTKGVFIDGIDGAQVKSSGIVFMGIVGGHTVTLAPGKHAINAELSTSNFHSYKSFVYTFDPGVTYEVAPNSVWAPRTVEIKNLKTGDAVEVQ